MAFSHRALRIALVCAVAALWSAGTALAQIDCSVTHVNTIPLIDMGISVTYQGYPGLLYPGTNVRPRSHDLDLDRVGRTVLRNAAGDPDSNGAFVLIAIGNSAADLEFSTFIPVANGYFPKNSRLGLIDCAQFGMNADEIIDPDHIYWHHVDNAIGDAGFTTKQVSAVWLKESIANPTGGFPGHQQTFRDDLRIIVQIIKSKYPNVQAIYFTSRIYGGYGPTGTSPEPYAYEYGFGVKWLIEEQLSGAPDLNFDPAKGPVMAPWLAWGPYMWADGILPRSDGLTWRCNEFQNDGRHLNGTGRAKFANYLLSFFNSDPTTVPWFVDCDLTKADVFAKPPEVRDNVMSKLPGGELDVAWESQDALVGVGAVYDVVRGRIEDLRADRGFQRASCLTQDVPDTPYVDTATDLAPGQGWYYLIRGRDSCGSGSFGDSSLAVDPRDALDTVACTASSCGDGIIDPGETCDAGNLGGQTCASQGYFGGTLACTAGCTLDVSGCNNCGDGDIDAGEQCDGAALGGQTCQSQGFPGGTLFCSPSCTLDTSTCLTCGDGDIDAGEQCDGADLGGQTCESQGFTGGTLACGASCTLDVSGCSNCGDGDIDAGEQCDGADLGGASCASQGYAGGTLACSSVCSYDTSACTTCGDGDIDAGEQCDGADFGGATCESQGFTGGTLACAASCTLDTTGCTTCGDGTIDAGEQCDGADLGGASCASQGYAGGTLACSSVCSYDTSACTTCGDGDIDAGEQCDGADLGGQTCESQGFTGGTLACGASCTLDVSGCSNCGDGDIDAGEQCDGADLGGATCESLGFTGGTLACAGSCTLDTSGCTTE